MPKQIGIDWTDLEINNIDLRGKNLRMKGGIVTGIVSRMSFNERSGFNCLNISGEARIERGKTIVRNIRMQDDFSSLDIPLYMMSYENVKDFSDYINKVRMDGVIEESLLDFRTIAFFAPALKDTGLKARIYS